MKGVVRSRGRDPCINTATFKVWECDTLRVRQLPLSLSPPTHMDEHLPSLTHDLSCHVPAVMNYSDEAHACQNWMAEVWVSKSLSLSRELYEGMVVCVTPAPHPSIWIISVHVICIHLSIRSHKHLVPPPHYTMLQSHLLGSPSRRRIMARAVWAPA